MNQSIKSLLNQGLISVRAYNVCRRAELTNLIDVIRFYKQKGTFKNIRNCGISTQIELIKLFEKYENKIDVDDLKTKTNDTDCEPLDSFEMTSAARLYCELMNITNSKELIDHYLFNNTFDISKNDNKKDVKLKKSIVFMCKEIIGYDIGGRYKGLFEKQILSSPEKLEILKFRVKETINFLSVRSKNALNTKDLISEDKLPELLWKSFIHNNLKDWPNVGAKSVSELIPFFEQLRRLFHDILLLNKDPHSLYLRKIESKYPGIHISQDESSLMKNKELNFINFLWLNKSYFFGPKEINIIDEIPRNELSKSWSLTIERVRQLSIQINNQIDLKIIALWSEFKIHCSKNVLELDKIGSVFDFKKIHHLYNLEISDNFVKRIITKLNSNILVIEGHELIDKTIFSVKERHAVKHIYNDSNTYIFADTSQYTRLKTEINAILDRIYRRSEDFFTFKTTYVRFIFNSLSNGLNSQYGIHLDPNQNIFIFRHTLTTYCYLTLEHLGSPSKLDEIYDYIESNSNFTKKTKKETIRSTITRGKNSELFFSMGKTSTYGLKIWNKDEKYATGSIKEECIEMLVKSPFPLHVNQLYDELVQRRPDLGPRSIPTILSIEIDIFEGNNGFFYLKSKNYNEDTPINHGTARSLFKKVSKNYVPLKNHINNPILLRQLESLNMPKYQLEYLKSVYLSEAALNKDLNKDEQKVRELYLSGEQFLALQSLKKYFKNKEISNDKLMSEFNRIVL